jgi:hypothetical protein
MSRIGIAPAAIARWRSALEEFAMAAQRADLKDVATYPPESVFEVDGGCLVLCLRFPSGDEVSMKIAPGEWHWSRAAIW